MVVEIILSSTIRDMAAYPTFKKEKYFHCVFHATAKAQGMGNIIDPEFCSMSDPHAQLFFAEQQSFMYSVPVISLQTEQGKKLVKEYEDDAQIILSELHENHTNSEMAQHAIVELTSYITNLHLTDTWKGTTQQFLAHFNEKLCPLDSFVPYSDHLPESTWLVCLPPTSCSIHP